MCIRDRSTGTEDGITLKMRLFKYSRSQSFVYYFELKYKTLKLKSTVHANWTKSRVQVSCVFTALTLTSVILSWNDTCLTYSTYMCSCVCKRRSGVKLF